MREAHPRLERDVVTPIRDPERSAPRADVEIRCGRADAFVPASQALTEWLLAEFRSAA